MADKTSTIPIGMQVNPQNGTVLNVPITTSTDGMISDQSIGFNVASPNSMSFLDNVHNDTPGVLKTRTELVNLSLPSNVITGGINGIIFDDCLTQNGLITSYTNRLLLRSGANMYTINPYTNTPTGSPLYSNIFEQTSFGRQRFQKYQGRIVYNNSIGGNLGYIYSDSLSPTQASLTQFNGWNKTDIIQVGYSGMVWGISSRDKTCTLYNSDPILTTVESATYNPANKLGSAATQIRVSGGQTATAIIATQNSLYLFTQDEIRRVYAPEVYDVTPALFMGTPSQECVVKTRDSFFFYNVNGIFQLAPASQYTSPVATEISFAIKDFIRRNVVDSNDVRSWADQDNVYFYLGSKLATNTRISTVVKYNLTLKTWTTYSFINKSFSFIYTQFSTQEQSVTGSQYNPVTYICGSQLNSSNAIEDFVSEFQSINYNQQELLAKNESTDKSIPQFLRAIGTALTYDIQTHWQTFDLPNVLKRVNGIYVAHEYANNANVYVKLDKDSNDWVLVGTLNNKYLNIFKQFQSDLFYRIKLRIAGSGRGTVKSFYNMGFYEVDYQGYDEQ